MAFFGNGRRNAEVTAETDGRALAMFGTRFRELQQELPAVAERLQAVLVTELRMQHQVGQVRRGEAPDNHIDPSTLTPLVRTYLRDAFRAVARVQRGVSDAIQYGTRPGATAR